MTRELNPKALEKAAESWGQCSESLGSYVRLQFAISAYLDETERAPDSAPSGWRLVPVEPTPEMIREFHSAIMIWQDEIGEDADVYRAMLAAAPEPPVSAWRSRETAPKDGAYFLAWVPLTQMDKDQGCIDDGDMRICWFEGRGQFTSDRDLGDEPFTHWQPLPDPPKQQEPK